MDEKIYLQEYRGKYVLFTGVGNNLYVGKLYGDDDDFLKISPYGLAEKSDYTSLVIQFLDKHHNQTILGELNKGRTMLIPRNTPLIILDDIVDNS